MGRVGNFEDVDSNTEPGLVLMGGSTDVDQAMRWMITRSGGGDFVIIRSSGGTGYNDYLFELGQLNSVETLLINSVAAANHEGVFETIKNAEALFIAGGDQSQYLRFWEGTKTEEALQYLIHEKKVPIGGTSAGCAVMGEFVYTGENGSIISSEALSNPFDSKLTVRRSTLINHPFLQNTITDQHFSQRNRQGRLVAFMARLREVSNGKPLKGIAVDEKTAVIMDKEGDIRIMGQNKAYFILENEPDKAPEVMTNAAPLTWNLHQKALKSHETNSSSELLDFNLKDWDSTFPGFWYVEEGTLYF
ncbi:cyanophycinase [Pleomorphovibrio marinus]|uniref:cyanophycinase n=1 Tax=Pleomorphovibrio marinus TaxID=2164132 RepID=UPI0018E5084A|nr:cyanophycinase [Pleomorphovibrio marinus]